MEESVSTAAARAGRQRIFTGHASYVFWVMFGISALNYLDRYVLTGAANKVAQELNFELDGIGYISSAFLVVYTLASLPLGIWADRVKRRSVVALCVAIWSVVTVATALATNFVTLFISRMFLGIGEAGYFPAGTALMGDYFRREVRSRVMSWWSTAQLFGILGGFGLGGVIAGLGPGQWRWAFVFTGIPGLLLAYLAWRVREPRRNQADEEALALSTEGTPLAETASVQPVISIRAILDQIWSLLRIRSLAMLIIMQIFAFFVLGVNTTFLPTYLQQKDTFSLSSGLAGLYSGGVIVVAGIIGTLLGGYMADVLNRRYPGARILVCGIG
ncbi:MAG: MFS transporter, partial [Ktedonobacteraceae bacterium]|nr:MFS transporter [Ktedonobacteraceae bacterium]